MNNSSPTPNSTSAPLLIRWRGRQEGPYSPAIIAQKLAANEIGLLHEVFHNSQWVTLRDYFAAQEAVQRAERQAQEEAERRAREAEERKAREREESQRTAALAEEHRKAPQPDQQAGVSKDSAIPLSAIHNLLIKTVFVASLLAFFLPNVTVSLPVVGAMDVSMFDFFTSRSNDTKNSGETPKKPSIRQASDFHFENASIGGVLCAVSVLALMGHYLLTLVWGTLTFSLRRTFPTFNTVWLCLGLQFPILFSIAAHMALTGLKTDVANQAGNDPGGGIGTALGLIMVNNTSIRPGVTMWILMLLALAALATHILQRTLNQNSHSTDYGPIPK
jgi:hypothetical protein